MNLNLIRVQIKLIAGPLQILITRSPFERPPVLRNRIFLLLVNGHYFELSCYKSCKRPTKYSIDDIRGNLDDYKNVERVENCKKNNFNVINRLRTVLLHFKASTAISTSSLPILPLVIAS